MQTEVSIQLHFTLIGNPCGDTPDLGLFHRFSQSTSFYFNYPLSLPVKFARANFTGRLRLN